MYPVFCVRGALAGSYAPAGRTADGGGHEELGADSLCGSTIKRRGVYAADRRTEECESGDRFTSSESGILFFSAGRMGYIKTAVVSKGRFRMYTYVCSDHIGAASGEAAYS